MSNRLPKEDSENTIQEVVKVKSNIYWAPAKTYQLANFEEEKLLESGRIAKREVPLVFHNHILQTSDAKTIAYIEGCDAFDPKENTGQVRKCDTIEEALKLTANINVVKSIKTIQATEDSRVNY